MGLPADVAWDMRVHGAVRASAPGNRRFSERYERCEAEREIAALASEEYRRQRRAYQQRTASAPEAKPRAKPVHRGRSSFAPPVWLIGEYRQARKIVVDFATDTAAVVPVDDVANAKALRESTSPVPQVTNRAPRRAL